MNIVYTSIYIHMKCVKTYFPSTIHFICSSSVLLNTRCCATYAKSIRSIISWAVLLCAVYFFEHVGLHVSTIWPPSMYSQYCKYQRSDCNESIPTNHVEETLHVTIAHCETGFSYYVLAPLPPRLRAKRVHGWLFIAVVWWIHVERYILLLEHAPVCFWCCRTVSNVIIMKWLTVSSLSRYSSTCHGRPPLVQRISGPSWQVAPRDRERTYAPLCQIKHTHQTAYISQHMHKIMKHRGQLQCCIGLQWEMKRTMLKMCEKINSIYPQCNAYRWTHTCAVLYFKICRSNRRRFEMSHGNWPL